jgi:beta-glucosidase
MLASTLGAAYVKGLQGSDMGSPTKAAACLKHYAGYSYPLNGKDRTPAWIDERMMREYFLPPFEAAVKAGAPTVMVNSSEINGIPGHANYHLITEVLKKEWKFDGFVVSDWEDIKRLHSRDRVADSPKEAVRMAVMAGIDMSMVPMDFSFYTLLLELVKEKKVPMSRIDDAVRRILAVKLATGLFERPYPDPALKKEFATPSSRSANLRAAEESITLLKNEAGVLPLKKGGRVLVTGPAANMLSPLNSGWTITWQGDNEALYPKDKPTILRAIEETVGKDHVTYVPGTTFSEPVDIAAAVSAARGVDAVVLCLGEKAYCETPGNIDDLTLDAAQLTLAEELGKTGTPVILVLTEGRPRVINRIVGAMKGIALAFLPGMEGGAAIARVLFGDANPCGKLPFSYPRFPNSIVPYDHKPIEIADVNRYDPQWAFGFGLSYTTFAYSDLAISRDRVPRGGTVDVSVTVKNTGTRGGKEVAQLYVTDRYGSVSRPVAQLKGFTKIYLEPGQSTTVRWTLGPKDLSFVGLKNTRVVEPGEFVVKVGDMSRSFTLEP